MNRRSTCEVKQRNVVRRLPSIRGNIILILITNSCTSLSLFDKNDKNFSRLILQYNCFIIRCKSILKCIKYLKHGKLYEPTIVIYNMNNNDLINTQISIFNNDFIQLYQYRQLKSIFLLFSSSSLTSSINKINKNYLKNNLLENIQEKTIQNLEIFFNNETMFVRLEELIKEIEESDENLFSSFYQQEKSLRNVHKQLGPFVWSHSYQTLLISIPYKSSQAKDEMLAACRAYYKNNREELIAIEKFEHSYRSVDAIQWYTKSCFLYRIINKALRNENIFAFYTFRYYIVDLSMRLKEEAIYTRNQYTSSFHLYRGSKLSRNEIEEVHVGTLVATNGYFSTSLNLNVAQLFSSIDPSTGMSSSRSLNDKQQFVLFDIDVDLTHSPETILADVSKYSVTPDENEFIFDLGTTFIIIDKIYDMNCYLWQIKMRLSSEMIQLTKDYSTYTQNRLNDTPPIMMFGHLLSDISSEYDAAMTYFHYLLETLPADDIDRPTIYFYLGRIYRFLGQHKNSIEYFRCALLLYRRRLPQSSIGYGRTLAGLATTYTEMGNSDRAIRLYERAIAIHQNSLPIDHIDIAMELNRLGYTYYQKKQYENAFMHLSRAMSFYKRKMPKNHPGHAQALHTIGLVQHALGNREKALDYYKQALHMRESLLSSDHPLVARTSYQISLLYAEQDDEYSTALDYAQRALNIRRIKLPPNHVELKKSIDLVERLSRNDNTT